MRLLKRIGLSKSQFTVVSEIARDIAQILFASMVITPILLGTDKVSIGTVVIGIFTSFMLWVLSVIIKK